MKKNLFTMPNYDADATAAPVAADTVTVDTRNVVDGVDLTQLSANKLATLTKEEWDEFYKTVKLAIKQRAAEESEIFKVNLKTWDSNASTYVAKPGQMGAWVGRSRPDLRPDLMGSDISLRLAGTNWTKVATIALAILLLIGIALGGAWLYQKWQAGHDPPVTQIDYSKIKDVPKLKESLHINTKEAQQLSSEIEKAEARGPEIQYVVQAPTVEAAATQVETDIKTGTSPANKIPADKTIVTPNTKEQKVEVFRITLDKPRWGVNAIVLAGGSDAVEVGLGPSYKNKDWAANAGMTTRSRYYLMGTKYF